MPRTGSGYRVGLFNPASTVGQISRLRLINRGAEPVAVTIEGKDDGGESPGGAVRLTLPARGSRQVTATELESGEGEGLVGALGDGNGRWRLLVTADGAIEVMNLLASTSSGAMTNLSSGPVGAEDGDDGATTIHEVGLFPSASDEGLEGVLRIVNRTRQAGQVSIEAIDDTGVTFGPVTVGVSAQEALVLTSGDLEEGNTGKGLPAGTGAGTGDWRLRLSTSLAIAVLSYVHPLGVQDGLLSAMHDVVPRSSQGHQVTLFDPGETPGSTGSLRLINPSTTEADITIRGVDGTGATPGGEGAVDAWSGGVAGGDGGGVGGRHGDGVGGSAGGRHGAVAPVDQREPADTGDEPFVGTWRPACESVHGTERDHGRVFGCAGGVWGHGDGGGGVQRTHLGACGAFALHLLPCGGGPVRAIRGWCSRSRRRRITRR